MKPMKSTSRIIIALAVAGLTLLAVASSGAAIAEVTGPSPISDVSDDDSVSESNVTLSEQEAIDIATDEIDGTVNGTQVELENEDGSPVYEVEGVTTDGSEVEVAVHADDGTVLETETEDDEDDEDERENEHEDDENEQEDNEDGDGDQQDEHGDDEDEQEDNEDDE
ncbi:PepSY domain-containing protein [Halorubrum sp. RMP-47]|uniref:PepSY domain-containing protein n=1 Tax=Halorubrum miltondacostae TaxID=3076378 RepID=A0ABD5LXX7_9EURY